MKWKVGDTVMDYLGEIGTVTQVERDYLVTFFEYVELWDIQTGKYHINGAGFYGDKNGEVLIRKLTKLELALK